MNNTEFTRKYKDIIEAEVRTINGTPRLFIDGEQTEPLMFSALFGYENPEAIFHEMKLAGEHGVRIIRTSLGFPIAHPEQAAAVVDKAISEITEQFPDALVLIALSVGSDTEGIPGAVPEQDLFLDQHGNRHPFCSLASEAWIRQAQVATRALVRYVRSVPEYSKRVIGYQPCAGSAGEWFGPMFWEGLVDLSPANTQGFRRHLVHKYGSDSELARAWGEPGITLDTAEIPRDIPGFGASDENNHPLPVTLILSPEYQRYTDYEDYYSAMLADRIESLCRVVKKECEGRSLAVSYFGYHSEVRVPFSGSFGLHKLLKSPFIDMLAAPVSYHDRNEGGSGAYMSPVSSIHAAGKLWIDEGDYRTSVRTSIGFAPGGTQEGVGDAIPCIVTKEATDEVVKRQIGKGMVYGSGVWWLDLVYRGWFDYPEFWENHHRMQMLAEKYSKIKKGVTPDVAIVYDELAMNMLGQPWQVNSDLLTSMRKTLYHAGFSFGYYSSEDVISGKTDGARVYFMLTPWRYDSADAIVLKGKFEGKAAVWLYGNGATAAADFEDMTGFLLEEMPQPPETLIRFSDGLGGSFAPLSGKSMHIRELNPLYAVKSDSSALAVYPGSGKTAAAFTERPGYRSFFYGATNLTDEIYTAFAVDGGAHRFLDSGDVLYADGSLVVVHTVCTGIKHLKLPYVCDVYDYFKGIWHLNVSQVDFESDKYITHLFFYGNREDFRRNGIGD